MTRLPAVLGLVFCEAVSVDPHSGNYSLVALFQRMHFKSFPSRKKKFIVYAALYDGVGEGTMKLIINRLETEEDIYSFKRWYAFPGRGRLINAELPITKCSFPAPGKYLLTLSFDGNELEHRYLEILKDES